MLPKEATMYRTSDDHLVDHRRLSTRPATQRRHRVTRTLGALVGVVVLASCSGTGAATEPIPPAEPAVEQPAGSPVPAGPDVKRASTSLGDVLVGPEGMTLYAFTNDADGASSCSGRCAEAWPPLLVGPDWDTGPELDVGIFATTTRPDGSEQLVAGKWPLYYYAGDAVPGDVTGQGSGDVWFVVDPTGTLIKTKPDSSTAAAPGADTPAADVVGESDSPLGRVLVDGDGRTLYGFTKDTAGTPTCEGACAEAWPALTVEDATLPAGVDPAVFSVVARADGSNQLKAGTWPLYRFAGDAGPGDVNGQASGGVWFVVDPEGSLIRGTAAAPTTTTAPKAPSRY
jgi:predicted lipoprotein with Yx(FWY)xxD motif